VSHKSTSLLFCTCPITTTNIANARAIFGPSVPCTTGEWVRPKPERVELGYVYIPANLISDKYVVLAVDVMFVCGLPFLITLSRCIRFVTVQFIPHRTAKELDNILRNVIKLYSRSGFTCQTALMDGEFENIKDELLDTITCQNMFQK
jgi:hypothetical protein